MSNVLPRGPIRRALTPASVIFAYLAIGAAAFWPVLPTISDRLFGSDPDFTLSVWFLAWVPHALAHGLNPFFSNAMFVPTGVNLAVSLSSPLLGLLATPLNFVSGPVVAANVLMVLAMPVSACAAYVVLRKWQVWGPAAAIGGLAYGFSPYMVGQALGHVALMFVPLPPFIALTLVSILQRHGSPRRLGIQLGLLVTAQYLISPEVLATTLVFTVIALACFAARHRKDLSEISRTSAIPAAISLVIVVVLLSYPIWMLQAGPQSLKGPKYSITNSFYNDVLSFVVPGPLQKLSLGMRTLGLRLDLVHGATEAGSYIGIPVLAVAGYLAWRARRSARIRLTVALFAGAVILSLGPYFAFDGRRSSIPLPFLVLDHLPMLDDILPGRIAFEIGAFLAAVLAFGLDDLRKTASLANRLGSTSTRWTRRRTSAAVAGLTLAVLMVTQLPQWPPGGLYAAPPAVVLPGIVRQAVPAGDPVAVTYPYAFGPASDQPLLWQAADGFRFRLLEGYAFHPNGLSSIAPTILDPPDLQLFLVSQFASGRRRVVHGPALPVGTGLVHATRTVLSEHDVRLVIVDRSAVRSGPVVTLFTRALGPPKLSTGRFSVWADWASAAGVPAPTGHH